MNNTLGPAPVRSERRGDVLSAERARVLEDLQHRSTAPTSAEIARDLGLHPNTARLHLEALVQRGLVERFSARPLGRGRPAVRYRSVTQLSEPDRRVRGLAALARTLAKYIQHSSPDPAETARTVGAQWAEDFVSTEGAEDLRDPVATAVNRLDELGFDSQYDDARSAYQLHRCPLLDVARGNPDVVCNMHLGLVRGTLSQLDADHVHADLKPFAEPGACLLKFATLTRDTADISNN